MFLKKKLKDKLALYFLKRSKSVSPFEICWQIQSYTAVHQIRLTETALILPDTTQLTLHQNSITQNLQKTPSCKNIIYFSDVIHVYENRGSLVVLLRNGYVYLLSGNTSGRILIDICPEKSHPGANILRIWWWKLSGNILFAWWYLKEYVVRNF